MAAAGLLLCVSAANAAPPANDDFADREALSGGLPIEVTRSNAEAMQEAGESPAGPFAAGHSVWFEWEATSAGWVTIGTCGSDFATVLGVYSGPAVDALTEIGRSDYSAGPNCPANGGATFGSEVTFEAVSGAAYQIVVDGNAFYLPPQEPPAGEGVFGLQIDAAPMPANDDFANAAALVGETNEEPGGNRFYSAHASGFNWGATEEPEEPDHAGDPGGASVWYSWTAPGSGPARIVTCCAGVLVGVYTGSVLGALTPVEPTSEPPAGTVFAVTAGTTYRIAVDGRFDAGAGSAWMGSFNLHASMELPPGPGAGQSTSQAAPAPLAASPAPDTRIVRRVIQTARRRATFAFRSSEPSSTFRCKLDKRPWAPCISPKPLAGLSPGAHTFKVAAVGPSGIFDSSPARARFEIPRLNGQRKGRSPA